MAVANKYQGKPIAFIAVNSGNSPQEVASYLRSNKVSWPTIVDPNRVFEKASIANEISLQNIWQFRTISADGEMRIANSANLEESIDRVVAGASWNVDPKEIPESLQKVWFAVEFGNYAAAARDLKKAVSSRNQKVKAGGDKLNEYVQQQLARELESADLATKENRPWRAFKSYSRIQELFEGYQMETDIGPILAELRKDEVVKGEIAAQKLLDSVRKKKITSKSAYARAVASLEKIVEQYPESEAADAARMMLESQQE